MERPFEELWRAWLRNRAEGWGAGGWEPLKVITVHLPKCVFLTQAFYDSCNDSTSHYFILCFVGFLHALSRYSLAAHSGLGSEGRVKKTNSTQFFHLIFKQLDHV